MNHAVKEILLECLLCVEIEPQPPENVVRIDKGYGDIWAFKLDDDSMIDGIIPPIAISDTVYREEEWRIPEMIPLEDENSETMPIELAGKTFKVVGIEVEFMLAPDWDNVYSHSESDKKWFWSYKLLELQT